MLKATGNFGWGTAFSVMFFNVLIWIGMVWAVVFIFNHYFHTPWSRI